MLSSIKLEDKIPSEFKSHVVYLYCFGTPFFKGADAAYRLDQMLMLSIVECYSHSTAVTVNVLQTTITFILMLISSWLEILKNIYLKIIRNYS